MVFCVNYTLFTYVNNSIHNYYSPTSLKSQETSEGESQENG
mgnify:CR=1 FL=1